MLHLLKQKDRCFSDLITTKANDKYFSTKKNDKAMFYV